MKLRHKSQTYKYKKIKFAKIVKQGRTNSTYSRKNMLEVSVNNLLRNLFCPYNQPASQLTVTTVYSFYPIPTHSLLLKACPEMT